MDGVEGIGELVTGGMLARAVEPGAGGAGDHGTACLNCGAALAGEYCHACGQPAHVHRSMAAFFHDLVHGVLHFEGKTWRTLPMLAFKPGELTRRYIAGERARFVSPMALFLFSVFMMFAVFSLVGGPFASHGEVAPERVLAEAAKEHRDSEAQNAAAMAKLEGQFAAAKAAGRPTTDIAADIAELRRDMELERRGYELAVRLGAEEQARERKQEEKESGTAKKEESASINFFETGWDPLDAAIDKAEKNPSLIAYKLQSNAYKFSWALIPLSVPFVWLLFLWRRQYKAYDHTIFVTYSIAFMSLGVITLSILRPLGLNEAVAGLAITFVPPIHMYKQLRGAYRLSRFSALWRTAMLIVFISITATLYFMLLLGIGVAG